MLYNTLRSNSINHIFAQQYTIFWITLRLKNDIDLLIQILHDTQQVYHQISNQLGNALQKLERYDEAISCYDIVISRNPYDQDAWYYKGKVLDQEVQNDMMMPFTHQTKQFKYIQKINFIGFSKVYLQQILLGEIYHTLQKNYQKQAKNLHGDQIKQTQLFDSALKNIDMAILLDPFIYIFYLEKGELLTESHLYKDAIACYDEAIQRNQDFYGKKIEVLQKMNNHYQAIICFYQFVKEDPNSRLFPNPSLFDIGQASKNQIGESLFELNIIREAIIHKNLKLQKEDLSYLRDQINFDKSEYFEQL